MKRNRYAYVILCNKTPQIYGIVSSYAKALKYAEQLIKHRKTSEGYYHQVHGQLKSNRAESLRLSFCIKGGPYDGDIIQIKQYPLG